MMLAPGRLRGKGNSLRHCSARPENPGATLKLLAHGSHLTDVLGKRGAKTDDDRLPPREYNMSVTDYVIDILLILIMAFGQVLARLGALQLRRLRANRGPVPADRRGMTAVV
jgi:hypothetical protein